MRASWRRLCSSVWMWIAGVTSQRPSITLASKSTAQTSDAVTSSHHSPQGFTHMLAASSRRQVMCPAMCSEKPDRARMRNAQASACGSVRSTPIGGVMRGAQRASPPSERSPSGSAMSAESTTAGRSGSGRARPIAVGEHRRDRRPAVIARRAASSLGGRRRTAGHGPSSSHDGSPSRANATHAACTASASAGASGPSTSAQPQRSTRPEGIRQVGGVAGPQVRQPSGQRLVEPVDERGAAAGGVCFGHRVRRPAHLAVGLDRRPHVARGRQVRITVVPRDQRAGARPPVRPATRDSAPPAGSRRSRSRSTALGSRNMRISSRVVPISRSTSLSCHRADRPGRDDLTVHERVERHRPDLGEPGQQRLVLRGEHLLDRCRPRITVERGEEVVRRPTPPGRARACSPSRRSARWPDGTGRRADGIAMRWRIDPPPADSPNTVTLPGSPPNASMLSRTQRSASTWSSRPRFGGQPGIAANPNAPRR